MFLEHRDVRFPEQFVALECQVEHAFQRRQLAVDLAVRRLRRLARDDEGTDISRRDGRHPAAPEDGREVLAEAALQIRQRSLTIHTVVVHDVLSSLFEGGAGRSSG